MTRANDPQEERIETAPEYPFRITSDERYITVRMKDGSEKPYSVSTLQSIYLNLSGFYAPPIVDMARRALEAFGKLPKREEDDLSSLTIATIEGIKVYHEWGPLRRFFAWIAGSRVYGSLSELEKKIKGDPK